MYRSKLFDIVLNHRLISLDCADQHVVQMCPELTKFLPNSNVKVEAGLRSSAQHVTEETAKVLFASITSLVKISETISLYNWY